MVNFFRINRIHSDLTGMTTQKENLGTIKIYVK